MNVSLYQAAAGLDANARWQELIARNLACSSIPGYKRQELSFAAIQGGLMPAPAQGPATFALPQATSATNFQQGEIRPTGVQTDLALDGPGFFAVQLPDGATAYTRDGEFHIDATGQLVTKQGYPVLGQAGPIQLDLNIRTPLTISATGQVSQGAELRDTLRVVQFNQPGLLTPIGGGYFLARHPALQELTPEGTTVRQGYLEGANTSAAAEMVKLIAALRQYEANQRVLMLQDERLGKTIADLGHGT